MVKPMSIPPLTEPPAARREPRGDCSLSLCSHCERTTLWAATAWSPELNLSRHRTSTGGLRPCFEECRGLCRFEWVGSAVGDQIVATATHFSPATAFPGCNTV